MKKRSVTIAGHRTSISLEEPFWDALREMAESRGQTLAGKIGMIDKKRGHANLSSAIRLHILDFYRKSLSK
ncbi:MAG: ribbon-helix-helix domain-containing protein [Pseudomonadota bacterium]